MAKARSRYPPGVVQQIDKLVRQAQTWSSVAAQDTNPLIAYVHVTQALASAHLAQAMVDAADIQELTGVSIVDTIDVLERQQHLAMQQIVAAAPALMPPNLSQF
jgi:hypothetical protein